MNSNLQISISPGTVYINTTAQQSAYANLAITVQNSGGSSLDIGSIAITLPAALAPVSSLGTILPGMNTDTALLWDFAPSQFAVGEFDADPLEGSSVTMNAGDVYNFTLNSVTLPSTIIQPSAQVNVAVTFADGTTSAQALTVDMAVATAAITSFNSQIANISAGQTVTLNWQCTGIDYCIISPLDNDHHSPSGSSQVTLQQTTLFTLYAFAEGTILSAQWGVSVDNPQIVSFGGYEGQSSVDYGANINLVWRCNNYVNSIALSNSTGIPIPTDLLINNNTAQVGGIDVGPVVMPTTFVFTAYADNTQIYDQRDLFIGVNNVTGTFTASETNVWGGTKVTLTWNIKSASGITIMPPLTNGPSLQTPVGSVDIYPENDISYTVILTGLTNGVPASVTLPPVAININPVSISNFSATPLTIIPDNGPNQCTLSWNTEAEVTSINNGIGIVDTSDSSLQVTAPPDGTVYTLQVGTLSNPAQLSQSLTITNAYGPYQFTTFDYQGYAMIEFDIQNAGSLSLLKPALQELYYVGFTGGKLKNVDSPQAVAAMIISLSKSIKVIRWPIDLSDHTPLVFEWDDPNVQSGTIIITGCVPKSKS